MEIIGKLRAEIESLSTDTNAQTETLEKKVQTLEAKFDGYTVLASTGDFEQSSGGAQEQQDFLVCTVIHVEDHLWLELQQFRL